MLAPAAHLGVHAAQRQAGVVIGDTVGHIEDHDIHAGVGQHLRVLADDKLIVTAVIAEQRFTPEMKRRHRSVGWRGRIRGNDLGKIINLPIPLQPGKVENTDDAVWLRWTDFR